MNVIGKDGKDYELNQNSLGFWTVSPMPDIEALNEYYSQKYYQNPTVATYSLAYSKAEISLQKLACEVADHLYENQFPGREKTIYDIGCGEGFFLQGLKNIGWLVCGVDFSIAGVEKHNPSIAPYVQVDEAVNDINRRIENQEKFHLINLGNVLEHVTDPLALLKKIYSLLRDDGMLRIVVPNDNSELQKKLVELGNASYEWVHPPDHLAYFNFDNLPNVLDATGFKLTNMLGDFPIEIFLTNEFSNYLRDTIKGKAAHESRVMISNMIAERGLQNYITWSQGVAAAGIGRTCIAFSVKK